jgi:hypothetical protein
MSKTKKYLIGSGIFLFVVVVFTFLFFAIDSAFTLDPMDMETDEFSWIQTELGEEELISVTRHGYYYAGGMAYVAGNYTTEKTEGTYIAGYMFHPIKRQRMRRDDMQLVSDPNANMGLLSSTLIFEYEPHYIHGEGIEVKKSLNHTAGSLIGLAISLSVLCIAVKIEEKKKTAEPVEKE